MKLETTSLREESELFQDALDEFSKEPLATDGSRSHQSVNDEDDEALRETDDVVADPFAFKQSHLREILSLIRVRKLSISTDFGKVIGRTELVMRDILSRSSIQYEQEQTTYENNLLISKMILGDHLRRTGAVAGSINIDGFVAGWSLLIIWSIVSFEYCCRAAFVPIH